MKKILVLQTAFIGDVILATALVRTLAEQLPSAEIQFMTIPVSQEIVENSPYLKKVWIYDKRGTQTGAVNVFKLARQLKDENFDAALVPHRSLRSALLVYLAGIPRRIGFDRSAGHFLFSEVVRYPAQKHEIERNLELAKKLLESPLKPSLPEIFSSDRDRNTVDQWLAERGIRKGEKVVCLAPGSVWPTKRWPADYWKMLAGLLVQEQTRVILIGGTADKELASVIRSPDSGDVYDTMGNLSLRQSAEIIRRARLLVTNDSAPTHMGVAVGTPVLTLYGSTAPVFGFYPYGQMNRILQLPDLDCRPCTDHGKKKCPLGHFKCMLDLTPDTVFKTVMEMLGETNTN